MKYIYTAIFVPNEGGTKYYCRVPDLPGCITTGSSIDDAIEMITDAACSIIRIDTLAYRAATDTRAVRKNVSLPAWMAALAEKRGVNCSQVLQDGLMQLLNASHAR